MLQLLQFMLRWKGGRKDGTAPKLLDGTTIFDLEMHMMAHIFTLLRDRCQKPIVEESHRHYAMACALLLITLIKTCLICDYSHTSTWEVHNYPTYFHL